MSEHRTSKYGPWPHDPNCTKCNPPEQRTSKKEVVRYDVFSDGMREGYGEHWVQATDYDEALAEIERLTAELAAAQMAAAYASAFMGERDRLRADRDANLAAWERLLGKQSEGEASAFFGEVSQLLNGWKQGCGPGEWSEWDESVLRRWNAMRVQAAGGADETTAVRGQHCSECGCKVQISGLQGHYDTCSKYE